MRRITGAVCGIMMAMSVASSCRSHRVSIVRTSADSTSLTASSVHFSHTDSMSSKRESVYMMADSIIMTTWFDRNNTTDEDGEITPRQDLRVDNTTSGPMERTIIKIYGPSYTSVAEDTASSTDDRIALSSTVYTMAREERDEEENTRSQPSWRELVWRFTAHTAPAILVILTVALSLYKRWRK